MRTEVAVVQTEAKYLRGITGVFLAAAVHAIIVIKMQCKTVSPRPRYIKEYASDN